VSAAAAGGDGRPVVGHVVGTWLRGTENWIYDQVRFTRRYRPVILAKHLSGPDRFPWEPVHSLSELGPARMLRQRLARWRTGVYPHLRRAAAREGAALLHDHFGHMGWVAYDLGRVLRIPFVVSFYGVDMWQHERGLQGLRDNYRGMFAAGAGFIAEGPAAAARLVEIGAPAERVFIHRLGIDLERFAYSERPLAEGEPLRVLMAARFTEKKGMVYGVEAFCRAAADHPRLLLTVAGDAGSSAAERAIRDELHQIVATHGMEDRVRFTGFLPLAELEALTRTHHLLMHPSVHAAGGDAEGGHPVVLTQAAATGMPVLATLHCDIPEVVVDGRTGWLVPERDVDALTAALVDAAEHPERLAALGRAARRLVEARYDAARETLDAVYDAALGGGTLDRAG